MKGKDPPRSGPAGRQPTNGPPPDYRRRAVLGAVVVWGARHVDSGAGRGMRGLGRPGAAGTYGWIRSVVSLVSPSALTAGRGAEQLDARQTGLRYRQLALHCSQPARTAVSSGPVPARRLTELTMVTIFPAAQ